MVLLEAILNYSINSTISTTTTTTTTSCVLVFHVSQPHHLVTLRVGDHFDCVWCVFVSDLVYLLYISLLASGEHKQTYVLEAETSCFHRGRNTLEVQRSPRRKKYAKGAVFTTPTRSPYIGEIFEVGKKSGDVGRCV